MMPMHNAARRPWWQSCPHRKAHRRCRSQSRWSSTRTMMPLHAVGRSGGGREHARRVAKAKPWRHAMPASSTNPCWSSTVPTRRSLKRDRPTRPHAMVRASPSQPRGGMHGLRPSPNGEQVAMAPANRELAPQIAQGRPKSDLCGCRRRHTTGLHCTTAPA
jgi:hypothetical protein